MFSAASVCLSVCLFLFVCQHDNFRTIKRRMMKLGGYVHCTNISPSSNLMPMVKGQDRQGQKNERTVAFFRESSSGVRCSCGIFVGSGPRGRVNK